MLFPLFEHVLQDGRGGDGGMQRTQLSVGKPGGEASGDTDFFGTFTRGPVREHTPAGRGMSVLFAMAAEDEALCEKSQTVHSLKKYLSWAAVVHALNPSTPG